MLFLTQKIHSTAGCTELIHSLRGKSIYTLIIASSPSSEPGEINHSKICVALWREAFPFIPKMRHPRWVPQAISGETEEAAGGGEEKHQKPATSTKPSGSALRDYFGKGFDDFAPYLAGKQLR